MEAETFSCFDWNFGRTTILLSAGLPARFLHDMGLQDLERLQDQSFRLDGLDQISLHAQLDRLHHELLIVQQ